MSYPLFMSRSISMILLERVTGDGKYGDVLDVAEILGRRECGSATNAIAVMCRQSPLYRQIAAELAEKGEPLPLDR